MKATVVLTTVALAIGIAADLHVYASCFDRAWKGINEYAVENPDATEQACARYRARDTGNNQWDKCPDCTPGVRGDVRVCNSPGNHIGGDEWDYYCKQVGADYGTAS